MKGQEKSAYARERNLAATRTAGPAYTCACFHVRVAPLYSAVIAQQHPSPTRGRRLLRAATVAAALLVGVNALVQALNVLAAWWRHAE